jgi:2-polyprenyl-6-methoxyphenol hydroxylase-like FAD-dependent oxidoreductase
MSNRLPVLIVGAGPTGLMMACELARHGIPCRIIDKKTERTLSSNATWIQTRTIEIFDQIGIADRFLEIGHPCDAINLYADGKHLVKMPLNHINSVYPFILMLPQSDTERLLNERLEEFNCKVERPLELIDIQCDDNGVVSKIQHPDGHTETVMSDYLIACDGANSLSREKCGFHFSGEDLSEQFVVADAQIDFSYMPKGEIHLFFDQGTIFAAFPLGADKYRVAANLHLDAPRKFFTEREVIELVQERAHGKYYVTNVAWVSPFWIHGKIVKNMRKSPIFLAGDAAHIHSPAGGQGMNTGLQDAYNLAWKLALVINNKAKPLLLDTYHSERYPVVKKVVDQNEHFTKMALFDNEFLIKLNTFSQKLSQDTVRFSKEISMGITQLDIQYQNSPVIDYQDKIGQEAPLQGSRAPDIAIDQSRKLYDYFHNTQHNVLIFTGLSISKNNLIKIQELKKWLDETYSNLVKTHIVATDRQTELDDIIFDDNNTLHEGYSVKNPSVYIIRPDSYIAYCSNVLDSHPMDTFFKKYLC